jgi:hypothetical protein
VAGRVISAIALGLMTSTLNRPSFRVWTSLVETSQEAGFDQASLLGAHARESEARM